MTCSIHAYAERKNATGNWELIPGIPLFIIENYGLFGWLADVRNYSGLIPIAEQRGFPDDASSELIEEYEAWDDDAHSASWLFVDELLSFNYDAPCEDRRTSKQIAPNFWDGSHTCAHGEGVHTTYRRMFGKSFFEDLNALKAIGAQRVVFWFDN